MGFVLGILFWGVSYAAVASAQGAGAPPPDPVGLFLPIILIIVVFYFLLIRPQHKRLQAHQDMVASIMRGDVIVTSGGMVGKIKKVLPEKGECDVEIAPGVVVRIVSMTIAELRRNS